MSTHRRRTTRAFLTRSTRGGARVLLAGCLALATVAGCDSSTTGSASDGHAAVAGSVGAWDQAAAYSGPAATTQAGARTVAVGELGSDGSVGALAEAEVEADGSFRIEGVPAGRAELVVVAYGEGGEETGRVVMHERTRAEVTHRTHPIDARSTLHAHTWAEMRARGGTMSSAELALYLHADLSTAAEAARSGVEVAAAAAAALQAQAAFDAVLEGEGSGGLDAGARAELLSALAAERDASRDAGAGARASQDAFVAAAFDAFAEAGARMDALALASAAAATTFDATLGAEGEAVARLELARQALLVNLEARKRAVAEVDGNPLGLRTAIEAGLADAEGAVRVAGSIAQLRGGLEAARAGASAHIVTTGFGALSGIEGVIAGEAEAGLEAAVAEAVLWTELEASASTGAMVEAAVTLRARVRAAVEDLVASVPSGARADAGISAEVLAGLLVAFGAGPHCG